MQPATATRLKIDFAQATDPGRDPNKQVNEDSCGYAETKFGHLCVLCDGMGGHYGGREASRTAITTIFEVIEQAQPSLTPAQALKMAIEEAARRVYQLGGPPENRTRPGSTVVSMLLHDGGVDVAHVGDSRAYVIRSNQIYPLTRDHSMVQGMIDAGMLTEEQAIGHPDANKITRALGMRPEVDVEVRPEPMELFAGDVLLQASDGLTDLALGHDILAATKQALASGGIPHAANMLVKLANDRGGHDNITVQMVRVQEVGARRKTQAPVTRMGAEMSPQPAAVMATAPGTPSQQPYGAHPVPAPTDSGSGYGPHSSNGPRPNGPAAWGPPKETVAMTSPGAANPNYSANQGPVSQHAYGQTPAGAGWGQVQPTVTAGRTPTPPSAAGPGPTVLDGQGDAAQPWTSAMYSGPTPQGAPQGPALGAPPHGGALQQYQMDPAQTPLPLPPLAARYPPPNGAAPQLNIPLPPSVPGGGRPSRGGIVFVIIGLSSVIAILAIFIIWALFLR